MTKKQLVEVAEDLNDVLGIKPPIPTEGKVTVLTELIKEASKLIEIGTEDDPGDEDELKPTTLEALKELGFLSGLVGDDDEPEIENDDDDDDDDDDEPEILESEQVVEKGVEVKSNKKELPEDEVDYTDIRKKINSASKKEEEVGIKILTKVIQGNKIFKSLLEDLEDDPVLDDLVEDALEILTKAENKSGKQTKTKGVKTTNISKPKVTPKPKKEKEPGYNRVDSVCEALKDGPKTQDAWVRGAGDYMEKNGGKVNNSESKFIIRYLLKMEKYFDFGKTMPQA